MKSKHRLQLALKANALFSTFCGLSLILFFNSIANWMDLSIGWPLLIIGASLLPFAALVWVQATKKQPEIKVVKSIIQMDFAWVVISVAVILLQLISINFEAYLLLGIIALIVGDFGLMQRFFLNKWQKKT